MENLAASTFLDEINITNTISQTLAENLLGREQLPKILLRYADLKANFNAVTFDECTDPTSQEIWKFSSGVTPYCDYDDTSNVPIPITNPLFINVENIVSFDFPIWFNLNSRHRIMMVTQDPMPRSVEWYGKCRDAICSTTFGIHNATWRKKGNGGKRMWQLIQKLIGSEIGIYLTDCKKFYIQDTNGRHVHETEDQLNEYNLILHEEIKEVRPSIIVAFGNKSKVSLDSLYEAVDIPIVTMPHFSGQAQGKIREFFNWTAETPLTVDAQIDLYHSMIIKRLNNG